MIFVALLALVGRMLILTREPPEMRKGPSVASPEVAANAMHRMDHAFWNEMWTENPTRTFVTVDRSSRIYVDGKMVGPDRLADELSNSRKRSDLPLILYLNANKDLAFEKIQAILRVAGSQGFERFVFVVRY